MRCSPNKALAPTLRLFIFATPILLFSSCSGTHFDFSSDESDSETDTETDSSSCADLYTAYSECLGVETACVGESTIETTKINEPLGCTPPGLSLGFIEMGSVSYASNVDLFLWINPTDEEDSVFESQSSLSIFSDKCGSMPLGGTQTCKYEPWLLVPALANNTNLFVHVQTDLQKEVQVGYQFRPRDEWSTMLPPKGSPILCETAPTGILVDLSDPNPLNEEEVDIDMSIAAPTFEGAPWICDEESQGWRQTAFMIRNHMDTDVRIVDLEIRPSEGSSTIPFHYSLHSSTIGNSLSPDDSPLARSCQNNGPLPQLNALSKHWSSSTEPEPITVLILQVPPSAHPTLKIKLDVVPVAQ